MTDASPRFHLSLRVQPARLGEVVDFYAAVFGTPPAKRHDDHVQFDLVTPPLNLTLVPSAHAALGELDHLGLQVFSEASLDGARARIRAAGLGVREQPDVDCCYANQTKFWVTDPEGREVEVFLKHANIEQHGHAADESGGDVCCPTPSAPSPCCPTASDASPCCP